MGSCANAGEPAKVTIRYHGQSFFEIVTSRGTRIVTDPHFIDAYGRIDVSADLILVSHEHDDHNQIAAVKNFEKAKVIRGLRVVGKHLDWNPVDEMVADVHVRTVGLYHDKVEGMDKGKTAAFLLEIDGLHIVHLGDVGHLLTAKDIKNIGPVDVLLIPVGGVYALNGSDAQRVVEQLKPRQYILPMHFGTPVFDDVLPPDEFLEDQSNVKDFRETKVPVPGRVVTNELVVDSSFKPAAPVIVVLNYRPAKK
jgi:L-ascorbate metabolism protein UlaG (beta-lactamase superfamily)